MRRQDTLVEALVLFLSLSSLVWANTPPKPMPDVPPSLSSSNVILITLDGVRWQEFFGKPDPEKMPKDSDDQNWVFPNLWNGGFSYDGIYFGNPAKGSVLRVANPFRISLPAYESIMVGELTPCSSNDCGRVRSETLQERLVRELRLQPYQVASITSWEQIANAVESKPGSTFVNSGLAWLVAPDGRDDAVFNQMNRLQTENAPFKSHSHWLGSRWDFYTVQQAVEYLRVYKPRFLYIGLNDSDEYAHLGDYQNYISTLRYFDKTIAGLIEMLKSKALREYGKNTTLIVTTDHGRGNGAYWHGHGPDRQFEGSQNIWMYVQGPYVRMPVSVEHGDGSSVVHGGRHTHLDIRPTVEALMGLCPKKCVGCGHPLAEVIENIPLPACQ